MNFDFKQLAIVGGIVIGVLVVIPAIVAAFLRDAGLGVESDFYRFARCIRCDAWTSQVPPISSPTSEVVPDYESIELPRRGEALRRAKRPPRSE